MAEVKMVKVTGEELARRIQVQLEFSINDSEEMLNAEILKQIALQAAVQWLKLHKGKLASKISVEEIAVRVMKAIIEKAIFGLAVEMAGKS